MKGVSSLDQVRACQQVLGCNYKLVGPEDKETLQALAESTRMCHWRGKFKKDGLSFTGCTHQRSREGPHRNRDRPECVIKAILDPRSSSRPEIHDWRPQTDDATASHTVPECGLNSAASTAQVLHEMIQLEPPLQFLHQTTIHL
ncbi:hypothetical protein POM88_034332 [Heracleum sosnowskyi]|uniref:Uncharacterized protein n=1 Tax=Heracleum sosnowskyi TaxID=360622 RepID=A0AAD8HJ26_9APIA|nr:hypothetical protein POM88_034332 [Heracleum sosnowskyi]